MDLSLAYSFSTLGFSGISHEVTNFVLIYVKYKIPLYTVPVTMHLCPGSRCKILSTNLTCSYEIGWL
jgi:hypothetical protein